MHPLRLEEIPMIARTWHGITKTASADDYLEYVNKTGVAAYRTTQGNPGVYDVIGDVT